jgi:transcriptional regulator with XRE-family HTH domain
MTKQNNLRSRLGKTLQELRHRRDLSAEEVANCVGCHKQFLSNIERGICATPEKLLSRLATLYGSEKEILTLVVDETYSHFKKVLGVKGERYAAAYGRRRWPKLSRKRSD